MANPRRRSRRALDRVVEILDSVVPARPLVAVHSSPDIDDSMVALLRERPPGIEVVVLAENALEASARAKALGVEGIVVVQRRSRRGWWLYLRSRVLVSTHGMFGCRPRGRGKEAVGLWHGEFGKLIGSFAGEAPRHFDWVPVSSPLSRSLRSAEFALQPRHIHVVGSPRQRLLTARPRREPTSVLERRIVVWAPTYRTSVTGMVRSDGDPDALARTLPLDDPDLLALLQRHDATLWYRAHPSAAQERGPLPEPWVRSASNIDLEAIGISFYELLSRTDCFITDYSSLWVDFVLVDRPMIAFCPDLERYRADRGLALEPHEDWFPGSVSQSRMALLQALDEALDGSLPSTAVHTGSRARARSLFHTSDADPVAATWQHVQGVVAR